MSQGGVRRRRHPLRGLPAVALLGIAAAGATAQTPGTDIYVAPLSKAAGRLTAGAAVNVTDRPGYDNQPLFLPDGSAILYTSIRGDGQADTYRYDLRIGASVRLTVTPESEYSPTPLARGPGFSVVRVEADSTQRVWAFQPDGSAPRLLLRDVKPVGYHAWSDEGDLVLFVLGSPPTLQLVPAGSTAAVEVARDIGRGLSRVPGQRRILFAQRNGKGFVIESLDLDDRTVSPIARTPGSEFFAWADGTLFTADGSRILAYRPGPGATWTPIGEFAAEGIRHITRVAVSPGVDRIAFVAEDGGGVKSDK
ncbi:MAG: TolB family protein [Verrucomicrobiota bacterium]